MSCPTCSHTMQTVAAVPGRHVFWCPRCGTLKTAHAAGDDVERPNLVVRCRAFEECFETDKHLGNRLAYAVPVWRQLGIAESIHVPEERPA